MSAVKLDRDLVSATIKLGDKLAVAYNSEAMAWKRLADGVDEPDVDEILAIQTKPFPTRNAFSESADKLAKHLVEIGIDATSVLKSVQAANHYITWFPREWFDCKAYLSGLLIASGDTDSGIGQLEQYVRDGAIPTTMEWRLLRAILSFKPRNEPYSYIDLFNVDDTAWKVTIRHDNLPTAKSRLTKFKKKLNLQQLPLEVGNQSWKRLPQEKK